MAILKCLCFKLITSIACTFIVCIQLTVLYVFFRCLQQGMPIATACKYTYVIREKSRNGTLLLPSKLSPPNSKCVVCSKAQMTISIDTTAFTLEEFVKKVLKSGIGFHQPSSTLQLDPLGLSGDNAVFPTNCRTSSGVQCVTA